MTFADLRLRSLPCVLAVASLLTLGGGVAGYAQAAASSRTAAAAEPDARIGARIEMLGRTLAPVQAALSPDGATVAWSVRVAPRVQQIHLTNVVNAGAAKDRMVGPTGAACGNSGPVWSPLSRVA